MRLIQPVTIMDAGPRIQKETYLTAEGTFPKWETCPADALFHSYKSEKPCSLSQTIFQKRFY